ncbi:hypothetical protein [Nocardioides sp. 1609]|uniref:hypothetical protein n=1 Tax=Nocardioides sp. 1609 TaxID=2508327 RepID=UPI00106F0D82|nr:hypothetical protein [Nocardioides sp. 1609]
MLRTVTATTALLVASAVLPAGAGATEPAERRLRPYVSMGGGGGGEVTLLACKEPARAGRAWRLYLEVDNTEGAGAVGARLVARRDGVRVATWTSGRVAAGRVSRTTSVRVPRSADSVVVSVHTTTGSAGAGSPGVDAERC